MNRSILMATVLTGSMLLGAAPQSHAAPLTALVGGSTITDSDLLFDDFSYTDLGGVAVSADDIDVTSSSTATTVTLHFTFDPLVLGEGDDVEFNGLFDATVTGGSLRTLTMIDFEFFASVTGDPDDFPFIELGSNGPISDSVEIKPGDVGPFTFGGALPGSTTEETAWDIQGEAPEVGNSATATSFNITYTLEEPVTTPVDAPEPSTLSLLLASVLGVGVIGRRRSKGKMA